jgi:hypothetical protein
VRPDLGASDVARLRDASVELPTSFVRALQQDAPLPDGHELPASLLQQWRAAAAELTAGRLDGPAFARLMRLRPVGSRAPPTEVRLLWISEPVVPAYGRDAVWAWHVWSTDGAVLEVFARDPGRLLEELVIALFAEWAELTPEQAPAVARFAKRVLPSEMVDADLWVSRSAAAELGQLAQNPNPLLHRLGRSHGRTAKWVRQAFAETPAWALALVTYLDEVEQVRRRLRHEHRQELEVAQDRPWTVDIVGTGVTNASTSSADPSAVRRWDELAGHDLAAFLSRLRGRDDLTVSQKVRLVVECRRQWATASRRCRAWTTETCASTCPTAASWRSRRPR